VTGRAAPVRLPDDTCRPLGGPLLARALTARIPAAPRHFAWVPPTDDPSSSRRAATSSRRTDRVQIVPTVQVNDIAVYYEIHGFGTPLVLIGGLGADITLHRGIIAGLAQRHQVWVEALYDLAGTWTCGSSLGHMPSWPCLAADSFLAARCTIMAAGERQRPTIHGLDDHVQPSGVVDHHGVSQLGPAGFLRRMVGIAAVGPPLLTCVIKNTPFAGQVV